MRTEYISYLLEVEKTKSINKASKILHINPQHLGKIITSIESELDTIIFERTRTGIKVTQKGEYIIEKLSEIQNSLNELTDKCNKNKQIQSIKHITILGTYDINPKIPMEILDYLTSYFPDTILSYYQKETVETIENVSQNPNVFGIYLTFCSEEFEMIELPSNVKSILLNKTNVSLLTHENNPVRKKYKDISLNSVIKQKFVIYSPTTDLYSNSIYHFLAKLGEPNIGYCVGNLDMFYSILEKGNCVALGTKRGSFSEHRKDIVSIPIRENVKLSINLLVNRTNDNPDLVRIIAEQYRKYYML